MFNLSINPNLETNALCEVCGVSIHRHDPMKCPQAGLRALFEAERWFSCPLCRLKKVTVNEDDYYQCYNCWTVFSAGGHETEDAHGPKPRYHILDYVENRSIQVTVVEKPLMPRQTKRAADLLRAEINRIKKGKRGGSRESE